MTDVKSEQMAGKGRRVERAKLKAYKSLAEISSARVESCERRISSYRLLLVSTLDKCTENLRQERSKQENIY